MDGPGSASLIQPLGTDSLVRLDDRKCRAYLAGRGSNNLAKQLRALFAFWPRSVAHKFIRTTLPLSPARDRESSEDEGLLATARHLGFSCARSSARDLGHWKAGEAARVPAVTPEPQYRGWRWRCAANPHCRVLTDVSGASLMWRKNDGIG